MLQHPEEMGRIQNEIGFEPEKNERRRAGSLSGESNYSNKVVMVKTL